MFDFNRYKNSDMTYIVCGIYNDETFLMVDTIVNDNLNTRENKLLKSYTNKNRYWSMTGNAGILELIMKKEKKAFESNVPLLINTNFLHDLTERYRNAKIQAKREIFEHNRVFVIEDNIIFYIDIILNGYTLSKASISYLPHNTAIMDLGDPKEFEEPINNVKRLCSLNIYKSYNAQPNRKCSDFDYFNGNLCYYSSKEGYFPNTSKGKDLYEKYKPNGI